MKIRIRFQSVVVEQWKTNCETIVIGLDDTKRAERNRVKKCTLK
jgi:hypothetical protein